MLNIKVQNAGRKSKAAQSFRFSFKQRVKHSTPHLDPSISLPCRPPAPWNSGCVALTCRFHSELRGGGALRGPLVRVVACHRFTGPARALKTWTVCGGRWCHFSMKFAKGQPGVSCVFTAHFLPLPSVTPQPLRMTCVSLTHTHTQTHTFESPTAKLLSFTSSKNKKNTVIASTEFLQQFRTTYIQKLCDCVTTVWCSNCSLMNLCWNIF